MQIKILSLTALFVHLSRFLALSLSLNFDSQTLMNAQGDFIIVDQSLPAKIQMVLLSVSFHLAVKALSWSMEGAKV